MLRVAVTPNTVTTNSLILNFISFTLTFHFEVSVIIYPEINIYTTIVVSTAPNIPNENKYMENFPAKGSSTLVTTTAVAATFLLQKA